ncbi:MAG: VCBS repeat-containing protein [Ignavibacteriaceae bacterium]
MKKEDMMKHFKGGKIDLNTGSQQKVNPSRCKKNLFKILFAIFLFNSNFFFPQNLINDMQIPINGFCKYNDFKTGRNYTSAFALNYNKDSYSDILLYSPLKKKIDLLTGFENGEFSEQDSIRVPYQFSNIQTIFNHKKEVEGYAFASRRDRKAGIFRITDDKKFTNIASYNFSSYPENISVADIEGNGNAEMLISGGTFDGLSLLFLSGKKLIEKKLEKNTSYTDAVFVDLNNDDIPDISGFNLITNSIDFFYNYGNGDFRKVRSIPINSRISLLQSFDMDSDDYADLIFVSNNSISIFYGDFRSAFEDTLNIYPLYHPDKIILGDFNKDGKIDIAYINYDEEILSVIFAKGSRQFYPEIIYLEKKGIRDIIPFYSKFINGIAGISTKGELFTITKLSSFSENIKLTLGAEPYAITFFDNEDNGITDFCFIDELTNSLISVIRNNAGIPKYYSSFSLFQNHSEVTAFSILPNVKGFFCYSLNNKLIEAIIVNFSTNKVVRKTIYSHGGIMDLKIRKDPDGSFSIYTAYRKSDLLGIDIFKYSGGNFANENYEITVKDLASNLAIGTGKSVFFWKKTGDILTFYLKDFNNLQNLPEEKFSLSLKTYYKIIEFTGDLLNNEKDITVSFFNSANDDFAVVTSGKSSAVIKENEQLTDLKVENKDQLFFGEMRFAGLKKLFVHHNSIIDKFDFLNKGKELVSTDIAKVINMNRYFIKNMNLKNYHIVFTQRNASPISVYKINQ